MQVYRRISFTLATLLLSATSQAVQVEFRSDSDGAYTVQNSSTRNIDCIAPDICDVDTGRYRLIGFDDEHSVWVTVRSNGNVIYTYNSFLTFPHAGPAPVAPPVTQPVTPPVTPLSNAQFKIETEIVSNDCFISAPGRPEELTGTNGCAAMCPDGYSATGGNCRGFSDNIRSFNDSRTAAIFSDIRQPMIETPLPNGYQCNLDEDYQYGDTVFDYNNPDGTNISVTAICATIVSR